MTDAARVSTVRGVWSVVLAVGAPLVGGVLNVVLLFALSPIGSMIDPDYQTALRIGNIVALVLTAAMTITAFVLGAKSIGGASAQQAARPGRTTATVLGWIGISVSALVGVGHLLIAGSLFDR